MNADAPSKTNGLLRFRFGAIVCCAYAMLISVVGCKKAPPPAPPPPVVGVIEVTATNAPIKTEVIGQLDSPENVDVRARVEGFVDKILFKEGTEVKEGDPLFLLDKKPFLEALADAQGALAKAKADLQKSQNDVARFTPLAKRRAIPQQDLDNAVSSVAAGKASVASAEARVKTAELNLSYCDIRAPISGLIGAKQVSLGNLVGKGEPTLLATISVLDPIWFYAAISEVQYLKAQSELRRIGKQLDQIPVYLTMANGSRVPQPGKIIFTDRAVDPKTGTLRMRAAFRNPDDILRPGMFARLEADVSTRTNVLLLPEASVAELQGKNFAWVINPENKATQQPVTIGETIGDKVVVEKGLKVGDRVVVEGSQKLRDGILVQAKPAGTNRPESANITKNE